MKIETRVWTLDELILANKVKLGRGDIISKKDIASFPGEYPIYSSAREKNGITASHGATWTFLPTAKRSIVPNGCSVF